MRACARCDAAAGERDRFCTACGYELGFAAGQRGVQPERVGTSVRLPRLVACQHCGASNAASRRMCGRCGIDLTAPAEVGVGAAAPEPVAVATAATATRRPDGGAPATLVVVTILAALAVLGVLLTILSARGVGPFAGPVPPPEAEDFVRVPTVEAQASSTLPSAGEVSYEPGNLLDGEPTTAWTEGASGEGTGEWIEVALQGSHPVVRLLLWNGHQHGGRFVDNSRVRRVELRVGERLFTADLLDVLGPQAIDLPEPVQADRVRLTILEVFPGRRYRDVALSGLEVYALPE